MMLDFNDDRTYTKDVVLANVRYALLDPKSLQDNVRCMLGQILNAYSELPF